MTARHPALQQSSDVISGFKSLSEQIAWVRAHCEYLDQRRSEVPAGADRSIANERYISYLALLIKLEREECGLSETGKS